MSLVSLHRAEAEPARHRRDESAAAPRGEPAGARLRRRWRRSATSSSTPTASSGPASSTSPIRSPGASEAIEARLASLCAQAEDAVRSGYRILIISDRKMDREHVAIPALLALSAIHQHLVGKGLRTSTGLVVETGSAREVHHFALLGGYGAEAVHPYLALETLARAGRQGSLPETPTARRRCKNYVKAIGKGLRKVMSKMGISTYMSYTGAQIFEAVGLSQSAGRQVLHRHHLDRRGHRRVRGRRGGDPHPPRRVRRRSGAGRARSTRAASTPSACAARSTCGRPTRSPSCSTRRATNSYATYKEYAQIINDQSQAAHDVPRPVRVPVRPRASRSRSRRSSRPREIVKRFSTGAMSLGSISTEAHTTLAIAMNRIGGKSNTGEGGEDRRRYAPDQGRRDAARRASAANRIERDIALQEGDSLKSKIKQVASGRFGVTAEYLASRRADPDQDGAGRQARRGRPAARAQGLRVHRRAALLDARAWS